MDTVRGFALVLGGKAEHDGGAKMDVESKKLDGEPNKTSDKISWSTEGAPFPFKNNSGLAMLKPPDEALRAFAQAQELSSGMTSAMKSIQAGYRQM